jgi:DNA polymerase elongation subunit (family B)
VVPVAGVPPQPKFCNGFVDGADIVLLHRDASGQLLARRRRAEWSTFHETPLPEALARDLRNSTCVSGISVEGKWTRVRWSDPDYRRRACVAEEFDPSGPRGATRPGLFSSWGVVAYEGDVDPIRRYFSETGAEVAPPRRVYVDIETDSRVPPAIARKGKARVLCWSLVVDDEPDRDARDRAGIRVVAKGILEEETDEAEAKLLEAFWKAAEPFDQLLAWFGDLFDFPILKTRSQIVGANVKDPRRWLYVDQAEGHERMNKNAAESGAEKESLALDYIARELVGEGKMDGFDASKSWDEWAAGGERRQRLLDYCVQDTTLLPRIERRTGYVALNGVLCEIARAFQETATFYPIPIMDGFLLRMGVERGMRFPTKARPEGEQKKYAGAHVFEPKFKGIRRNVHCLDFSGMYPSIMISFNMSPETRSGTVPVNGPIPPGFARAPLTRAGFANAPEGLIPIALKKVRGERKRWSKLAAELPAGTPGWYAAMRWSNGYKVAANVFYGGAGSPFCRFHDRPTAESTSTTGVWLIQKTVHAAESRTAMRLEYGDTDSAMLGGAPSRESVADFVAWCNRELYPAALAECGCAENAVEIAYEKEFERIVFCGKKNYFGVFRHFKWTTTCECDKANGDPGALDVRTMTCRDCGRKWESLPPPRGKPEVKGLAYKRGDANRLARKLQYQVVDRLMRERCEDPREFVSMIEEMRRHVLEDPLSIEEVRKGAAISKSLREYKAKVKKDGTAQAEPAHVQVGRILKDRGEQVEEGVKVFWYVTDASESPMKVSPAADYANDADRFYLWENAVYPATQQVLEATFPPEPGMSADDLQLRDWDRFASVRPKKPRSAKALEAAVSGTRVPKKWGPAAPPAQESLFAAPAAPLPRAGEPFVVELDVDRETRDGARAVLRVKEALRKYPGERPVELRVAGAVVAVDLRVAISDALVRDVEAAKVAGEAA